MTNKPISAQTQPPRLAMVLLKYLSVSTTRECLTGDLLEEFAQRSERHPSEAVRWFWRQAIVAAMCGVGAALRSASMLKILMYAGLALVIVLYSTVVWLSNMDATSEVIWQQLLAGEIHLIVLQSEYWQQAGTAVGQGSTIGMFVNVPSILWAGLSFGFIVWYSLRRPASAHQLAGLSYLAAVLPYLGGLIFIAVTAPEPRQVGPVLAFMLISMMYILPVGSVWVLRKLRVQEGS